MFLAIFEGEPALRDEVQIIRDIDMGDCVRVDAVYFFRDGVPVKAQVFGPWHIPTCPLFIRVCDDNGATLAEGYGTDH